MTIKEGPESAGMKNKFLWKKIIKRKWISVIISNGKNRKAMVK